ncbi:glycosyltransferase [Seohaeicola saemankumensis]|nr:glycosyltransferase [Seohaeicola saemankumensis]MCA0873499.1 glycosyltransferase [Seohaeicola saemankumensis]
MINRLRGLFQRYARTHRYIEAPGFDLSDSASGNGGQGYVDRVVLAGSRVTFVGWSTADRILLTGAEGQSVTRPAIPRQDVAAAVGVPPRVGFEISQNYGDGRFSLSTDVGGVTRRHDVAPIPVKMLRRNRRRLATRFLWTLLRLGPQIVRAMAQGDPAARAAVKSALGLQTVPEAGPMETQLFAADGDVIAWPDPEPITLILPVYNAFDLLPRVLQRVLDNTDLPWRMIVVEDCSSDPEVRPWLTQWVAAQEAQTPGRIELILNQSNKGFIGSVNSALARSLEIGNHVVLLNSDAFVPPGWASRLLRPMRVHADVATVTPMSNDAEIFSVPAICQRMPLQLGQCDAIDAVAKRFHPEATLSVCPTGVGFCMALNIDYLRKIPQLDPIFGRGYGEEVDWCQKARALGGRHLGLPGLFVEHRGGESFGSEEKLKLVAQNNERIAQRYPDYDTEVQQFVAADPLVTARVALAVAWAASRSPEAEIPIYLAHSLGGGAEHYLADRIERDLEATGRPAIVLRVGGGSARWQVEVISEQGSVAGTTDDFAFVEKLLAPLARRRIVYSCGVGDPDPVSLPKHLLRLKRGPQDRIEVLVHDFFMLSPSYTLLDDDGAYRGPVSDNRADKAHTVMRPEGALVSLAGWRVEWGALLGTADEVVVFSEDSRAQMLAVFPGLEPQIVLRPHDLLVKVPEISRPAGAARVVAVLGNIGYQKGAAVVAELGRMLEQQPEPGIKLVLIGNVDPAYMPPASVPVHGNYRLQDLPGLVARYGITDWLVPSVWPETFSYTTHEALATGLPVYAFDIGAQGDAVEKARNGRLIRFSADGNLARNVLNRLAQDDEQAAKDGQTGQ